MIDLPEPTAAEVATLVSTTCRSCHVAGGVAPFSFDTLGDLRRRSGVVEAVLADDLMPPRLAHERDAISGVRALGEADRQSLIGWLRVAKPTSDATPIEKAVDPLTSLGEPDVVLRAEAAWFLPREGSDRTHCFRFPLPKTMTGIRAWHLDPGPGRAAVHHAGFLVDEEGVLRLWDESDPAPGWSGHAAIGFHEAGHAGVWGAAQGYERLADGFARPIPSGAELVVAMHAVPTGKPEPLQPTLKLWSSQPEAMPVTGVLIGSLCLDLPPNKVSVVEDEWMVPVDVDLLSVAPRAWRICRKIEVSILNWKDEVQKVLSINEWDSHWRRAFAFDEPIAVEAGQRIRVRFTYDNTESHPRQPEVPPRRFVVGHGETYEEALLMLTVAPKEAADLTLLREAHDDLVLQRGDEYRDWWAKTAWNRGLERRER